ncbi:probable hexosyltransferase MUCI70 isoform X2 [Cryptomeria japonica]|uniref:probable hexosyltransferase MUCI70 isoform X2 n=1 Tax=Cryptomeria japonica TaxID=3369 RepID=UPI0027DAB3CF|nr:probable hexosyltransferase MUCI70 isoform X2 [Cryptomeria japonica]
MHRGDEREIVEETMTGGLGQRSGSTGSLQWLQIQQQHQLQQQLNPVISSFSPPINLRKSKVGACPSARERFGFWICRIVGRKRAGMSLLFLVSLLVFISFLFSLNKGEDGFVSEVPGIQSSRFSERPIADRFNNLDRHIVSNNSANLEISPKIKINESVINRPIYQNQSRIHPPVASADPSLPPGHPCQHFTLPPPPADKKRTGPRPCPVCYLSVEQAAKLMPAIPSATRVKNLTYVTEVASAVPTQGSSGSDFGGYPTLKQRDDYFNLQESMHVHCGFVKGSTPGNATGFDLDKEDIFDMHQCRGIVVASAVFGNYDEIQEPKNISEKSKSDICFFMFVDETTESYLRKSAALDNSKMIGLWRIVVVHNLPYSDARRNGKIPKLLLHRLFPNVRYSLWIDGKLELVVDPYQILERFLWRTNDNFAISRHYRRFDVFDEAEANKAAGKYDNASIDAQVEFYRKEGLTHYSLSKLPITSGSCS